MPRAAAPPHRPATSNPPSPRAARPRAARPHIAARAAVLVAAALTLHAPGPAAAQDAPDYRALFEAGAPYAVFQDTARGRRDLWVRNTARADAEVAGLLARARAAASSSAGPFRLLVVASDRCSDSVSTLPYLAALAEGVPGLELRIVGPASGRPVLAAHPLPDGRTATPTVVVLDGAFRPRGAWVERPAPLVAFLADPARSRLGHDARFAAKMAWYEDDGGRSAVAEVVALLEGVAR